MTLCLAMRAVAKIFFFLVGGQIQNNIELSSSYYV